MEQSDRYVSYSYAHAVPNQAHSAPYLALLDIKDNI